MAIDNIDKELEEILHERFPSIDDYFSFIQPTKLHPKGNNGISISTDPLLKGPSLMFFTKPDFDLYNVYNKNLIGDGKTGGKTAVHTPFSNKYIKTALTMNDQYINLAFGSTPPFDLSFNMFLTNACTGISGLPTISLDLFDVGDTWDGSKMGIPKSTKLSRQNFQVQLTFEDFHNGPIMQFHKLFIDYIDIVTNGATALIDIDSANSRVNYILNQILCYPIAIYYIVLEPDLRSIAFMAKLTGCFPISWPSDAFGGKINAYEDIEVTVPYYVNFFEAMDDEIVIDFNLTGAARGNREEFIKLSVDNTPINVKQTIEIAKLCQSVYIDFIPGDKGSPPKYDLVMRKYPTATTNAPNTEAGEITVPANPRLIF